MLNLIAFTWGSGRKKREWGAGYPWLVLDSNLGPYDIQRLASVLEVLFGLSLTE
jgi:hypothetical protein